MKNELYRKVIVPAKQSGDGDTPTTLVLTEETNGFAIFFESYEHGICLVDYFGQGCRDAAIEAAVSLGGLKEHELYDLAKPIRYS